MQLQLYQNKVQFAQELLHNNNNVIDIVINIKQRY
jgi:hypothetical protein